jgi:hypothetical protein
MKACVLLCLLVVAVFARPQSRYTTLHHDGGGFRLPSASDEGQPFNGFVGGGSYSGLGTSTSYTQNGTTATLRSEAASADYSASRQLMQITVGSNFNYWNATHSVLCLAAPSPLNSLNDTCYFELGGIAAYQAAYSQMGLTNVIISLMFPSPPRLVYTGLVPDLSTPTRLGSLFEVNAHTGIWCRWVFSEKFCEDFLLPGGGSVPIGSVIANADISLTEVTLGEPAANAFDPPASIAGPNGAFANPKPVSLIQNC